MSTSSSCLSIRIGENGSFRISSIEGSKVTFKVSGVEIQGPSNEVVRLITDKFGIHSEPKVEWGMSRIPSFSFVRYVEGPIGKIEHYILATQRKFMDIVEHFESEDSAVEGC